MNFHPFLCVKIGDGGCFDGPGNLACWSWKLVQSRNYFLKGCVNNVSRALIRPSASLMINSTLYARYGCRLRESSFPGTVRRLLLIGPWFSYIWAYTFGVCGSLQTDSSVPAQLTWCTYELEEFQPTAESARIVAHLSNGVRTSIGDSTKKLWLSFDKTG